MEKRKRIIAVFGVSGVGKSTLIRRYVGEHNQWQHLQAGTLIKAALSGVDRDRLRLTGNEQIMANQHLMIDKFWKEAELHPEDDIIFDGHSIIDTGRKLLPIPSDVIKALNPDALIFLQADPSVIKDRRDSDTERKRPNLDLKTLADQQQRACDQVKLYSEILSVSMSLVDSDDYDGFQKVLSQ